MKGYFFAAFLLPVLITQAIAQDHATPSTTSTPSTASLTPSESVANRVAADNAIFEEQYESDLRNFPERATAFGDYRYNDKLADYSLSGNLQRNKIDQAFLARLEAVSTEGFSDPDRLSHDILVHILRQRITNFEHKRYELACCISRAQVLRSSRWSTASVPSRRLSTSYSPSIRPNHTRKSPPSSQAFSLASTSAACFSSKSRDHRTANPGAALAGMRAHTPLPTALCLLLQPTGDAAG